MSNFQGSVCVLFFPLFNPFWYVSFPFPFHIRCVLYFKFEQIILFDCQTTSTVVQNNAYISSVFMYYAKIDEMLLFKSELWQTDTQMVRVLNNFIRSFFSIRYSHNEECLPLLYIVWGQIHIYKRFYYSKIIRSIWILMCKNSKRNINMKNKILQTVSIRFHFITI